MPMTVNTVQVDMPTETVVTVDVNVPAQMDMTAVAMDMTDAVGTVRDVGAVHTVTATADALMTAAMRARISSAGRESCNADHGRRDESEKGRMLEHGRRPFLARCGPSEYWSKRPRVRFKRLIFSAFSFI
jgi:hypothetical protein